MKTPRSRGLCSMLAILFFVIFDWATHIGILVPQVRESERVVSNSLRPHGQNSAGQNTGVGSQSLLQGIFPTQGSNPGLPHCRRILYQLSHREAQLGIKPTPLALQGRVSTTGPQGK